MQSGRRPHFPGAEKGAGDGLLPHSSVPPRTSELGVPAERQEPCGARTASRLIAAPLGPAAKLSAPSSPLAVRGARPGTAGTLRTAERGAPRRIPAARPACAARERGPGCRRRRGGLGRGPGRGFLSPRTSSPLAAGSREAASAAAAAGGPAGDGAAALPSAGVRARAGGGRSSPGGGTR